MSADEALSPYQFEHALAKPDTPDEVNIFGNRPSHTVHAYDQGDMIGHLRWNREGGEIDQVHVMPEHRRRGVATALWHEANRIAAEHAVAPPQIGPERTQAGEALARSLGTDVPERKPVKWAWE